MLLDAEIKSLRLIRTADSSPPPDSSFDYTSYNLRLGGEYLLIDGRRGDHEIRDCSKGVGHLRLPPFACALVSTEEIVRLPLDVYGRWGLKIRPSMSGLIFQAGPQIEPGSNGRLFGLLFNLSSSERIVHHLTPMWSIDFERLPAPAQGASTNSHPTLSIADYTQMGLPSGSLNEIYADYRALQRENSSKREIGIAILLAIVTIFAGTMLPVVVTQLAAANDPSTTELQREIDGLEAEMQELREVPTPSAEPGPVP